MFLLFALSKRQWGFEAYESAVCRVLKGARGMHNDTGRRAADERQRSDSGDYGENSSMACERAPQLSEASGS